MKFTFAEWQSILHDLEVAARNYEEEMNDCTPSKNPASMYQIFKRQAEETRGFIERIKNCQL